MTDHDVVVVGGRVAGAATALLLARAGHRVLLLERGRPGTDTLSTHALMRPGVQLLHRWGLLDRVAAVAPPLTRTTIHHGDEAVTVPITPRDGVDALYAPRRTALDRIMVEAPAEAGADVRHGTAVTGLVREGLRVTGVRTRTGAGRAHEHRARLVVGADGRGSRVADAVGAATTWTGRNAAGYGYRYWTGLPRDGYDWHYRARCGPLGAGVAAGVIPTGDGAACVFVGTAADAFRVATMADTRAGYHRLLRLAAPELAEHVAAAEERPGGRMFGGQVGHLRHPHGPGWALVGDAGYFKDPITAHGITDAFRDAQLLADAVAEAGPEGDLGGYREARDRLSLPLARVTDEIAGFSWNLERLQELNLAANDAMKAESIAVAGRPAVAA